MYCSSMFRPGCWVNLCGGLLPLVWSSPASPVNHETQGCCRIEKPSVGSKPCGIHGPCIANIHAFMRLSWMSYLTVLKFRIAVVETRRTPKSAKNSSESLCANLWVPCKIIWDWFGPTVDTNPARNRRSPAGAFTIFGALLAQPSYV